MRRGETQQAGHHRCPLANAFENKHRVKLDLLADSPTQGVEVAAGHEHIDHRGADPNLGAAAFDTDKLSSNACKHPGSLPGFSTLLDGGGVG